MDLSRCLCFVVCTFFIYGTVKTSPTSTLLEEIVGKEINQAFKTGESGPILSNFLKNKPLKFFNTAQTNLPTDKTESALFCLFCKTIFTEILNFVESNERNFSENLSSLCVTFQLGTKITCEGIVNSNLKHILFIREKTPNLTAADICGLMFQSKGCVSPNPSRRWQVDLPETEKPPVDNVTYPKNPPSTFKILHIADTHFDRNYAPDSPVVCAEMAQCCWKNSTPVKNENTKAGYWGSLGSCDIPSWTLEAMYKHISETHKDIDLILWTGDAIPHNLWSTSRETNLDNIRKTTELIKSYFPSIPTYPAVGNHEADPANQFPQPYIKNETFSISWLYDELSKQWQTWLPKNSTDEIRYGAFYAVDVSPKLKIISVNTNFCYYLNWWLILDSGDIAEELNSLAIELQKSEDKNQYVYVIGHIPSGLNECLETWSHQFNRIIHRYEDTVSGLFFAHTHYDHFQIFSEPGKEGRPYEIGYIAQSQTTYPGVNPGYKIYNVEGDFEESRFRVLDHENWIMDLEQSNEKKTPVFQLSYNALEYYNLEDLSPASMFDFVLKMNTDEDHFSKFYRNYYKWSPKEDLQPKSCGEACRKNLLCGLLTSDTSDRTKCDLLS